MPVEISTRWRLRIAGIRYARVLPVPVPGFGERDAAVLEGARDGCRPSWPGRRAVRSRETRCASGPSGAKTARPAATGSDGARVAARTGGRLRLGSFGIQRELPAQPLDFGAHHRQRRRHRPAS